MADAHKGGSSGIFGKFFFFLVYVAAYAFLRYQGEIMVQQIALPSPGGGVEVFRMIGASPDLPHWRQQTWRAVFSLAMVAEEEGKKLLDKGVNTYRGAHNGGQNRQPQPGQIYQQPYPRQHPQQQQYYGQQPAQGQPNYANGYQQYPAMAEGERLIWDGRSAR